MMHIKNGETVYSESFTVADLKEHRNLCDQTQYQAGGGIIMSNKIRISMQYFAGEGSGTDNSGAQNQQQNTGNEGSAGNQSQQNTNNNSGATFSQADLNRIGAQEKANGKKSILKEWGFEDEKSAKEAITKFKEWQASQQSEAEKVQAKINAADTAKAAAETRAQAAENKLEIIKAGGNASMVDDIMALVTIRTNDSTDFKTALEAVKKDHPSFFGTGSGDSGTGGGLNRQNNNKNSPGQGLGARLAQNRLKNTPTKNPYFNN